VNRRLHLFVLPAIVAAISLAGLVVGLLGDGLFDTVAIIALAVPVAITVWSIDRSRRGRWG